MFTPAEIREKISAAGESKTKLSIRNMIILGIFAGMFIAFAAVASTFSNVYVNKLAGACVFPGGLAMVVVAGSELFTGNSLIIVSVLEKRSTVSGMLKNWLFVYLGNLIGSLIIVLLTVYGGVFQNQDVASALVAAATGKVQLTFLQAMFKGILCNLLVCIAVWMSFGAKTIVCKVAGVFFPIMMFIVSGYEHSIANMYYLPAGLLTAAKYGIEAPITIGNIILSNLLPVTIGNVIGGALMVGFGYFLVYGKKD